MIISNNYYVVDYLLKFYFTNVYKYVKNRCKTGAKHKHQKLGKQ